jgi:aryl-alcohol dehydrogenase-like predicted oxidoreductase
MRRITFGRTGLEVSVMGLGGGGPSRLGRTSEKSQAESEAVVREAIAGGINIFDSSESYGTEAILGAVLKEVPRDDVVICTKIHGGTKGRLKTPEEVEASLDRSLGNLETDHIDVYMLHAVAPHRYDVVVPALLPTLEKMKAKGKIRFIGITEVFNGDRGHEMLRRALADDFWDVIMVGFNILNTCARERVLESARAQNVGVFDMFAVRTALRDITVLDDYIRKHIAEGKLDDGALGLIELVRESLGGGECSTLPELAYRYCLGEPGIGCVLSGTGSVEHLRENIRAAEMPALGEDFRARLDAIVGGWDHLSAQL